MKNYSMFLGAEVQEWYWKRRFEMTGKRRAMTTTAAFTAVFLLFLVCIRLCGPHTLTEYIRALEASGREKQEVLVAVIDSGLSGLDGYRHRITQGYDFLQGDAEPEDSYGHGTQIAELILTNTPDNVKVMPIKTVDENGYAEKNIVCQALRYAAEHGADLVNLSLNAVMDGTEEERKLNTLVDELTEQGIQVIVSAGNTGEDVRNLSPAGTDAAIVAAAVDDAGKPCFYSGYGKTVDYCSLGSYNGEMGTSYSAAYVTSAAAILKMYGETDTEQILNRYAEMYEDREKKYGKGYVWLDSFSAGTEEKTGKNAKNLMAFSPRQEDDLGLDFLKIDWKSMEPEELERYFFGTGKEYVGMFLKSLSRADMELLEARCPALHSEVSVTVCSWDVASDSYQPQVRDKIDFVQYCIDLYEDSLWQMTISAWPIRSTSAVFYISNEDRSIRYRYEIYGNIQNKEAGENENNVLGRDGSLRLVSFGSEDPLFRKPQLASSGIKNYVTDITSRWVTYSGADVSNGKIEGKIQNGNFNTVNGSDNGNVFYGISIPFTGMTLDAKSGYHYAPEGIKVYRYGTSEKAISRHYVYLGYAGWVFTDFYSTIDLGAGFQKLSGMLTATSYTAKKRTSAGEGESLYLHGENTYSYCPNPTIVSMDVAKQYYDIKSRQVYKLTGESSFDAAGGEMTLNTPIYEISSLEFYSAEQNKVAYVNDTAEYVIAQIPDNYHVVLDANWGTVVNPSTGRRANTASVETRYDSSDYYDIGWLAPSRDGFIFAGWYTGRDDGEEAWDIGGLAKDGTYWKNNIWKYGRNWSETNRTLVFYAHWIPVSKVLMDANWGTLEDYILGKGRTNFTEFYTEYGKGYYDDISRLFPQRDGFTFLGWYVDPDDPANTGGRDVGRNGGVKVWDIDGRAMKGSAFWDSAGKWNYRGGNVTVFARWAEGGSKGDEVPDTPELPVQTPEPAPSPKPPTPTVIPSGPTPTPVPSGGTPEPKPSGAAPTLVPTPKPAQASTPGPVPTPIPTPAVPPDTDPPDIIDQNPEDQSPDSTEDSLVYGWTNKAVQLDFTAEDALMDSLILYEGHGAGGSIVRSAVRHVSYTAAKEGIFYYTLVAKDKAGNTSTVYITTKIDYVTPKGEMDIDYDGRRLEISIRDIMEENQQYPDNEASGCSKAWVKLEGLDSAGDVLCREDRQLSLRTPGNIHTGAAYGGTFHLSDQFNYESEYLRITAYVMDYAENYLPAAAAETIPAFVLKAQLERCLGDAQSWKAGEAGIVHFYTASFVDSVKIQYPDEWTALDETLEERTFDYLGRNERTYEKEADDLFYIPLRAEDGIYTITVHAYKDGHEKHVELLLGSEGTILDELRTRLR